MAAACALALAGSLAACGSGTAGSASGNTVNMGIEPWLGYAPWYIAQDQGYFKSNGVNATITNFDTDSDMNAALAAGKIQAASVASHSAIQVVENGVDVSIVLILDASEKADAIIVDDSIASVKDLKGKSVAYEEGSTSDLLLNYALDENGMTIDDIKKVPMGASAAGTAIIAGQVPAAVTYEPYITEAMQKDANLKTLYTPSEKEGLISDVFVVRNDYLKSNPDAVSNLVKAWDQSIDYYNANTDSAQEIIAKNIGSSKEDLGTAFAGVKYFTVKDSADQLAGEFKDSTLPAINKVAIMSKVVKSTHDPAGFIDASFAQKAAK